MRTAFFIVFIGIFLSNCTDNKGSVSEIKEKSTASILKKELRFYKSYFNRLDSFTSNNSHLVQSYNLENRSGFSLYNRNLKSIDIYLLKNDTTSLYKRFNLPAHGPNAIKRITGYYIKNLDSIYVFNGYINQVVLYDQSSKILWNNLEGKKDYHGDYSVSSYVGTRYPPLFFDSCFYLIGISYHHKNLSDEEYFLNRSKNLTRISLDDKRVISYHVSYPDAYQDDRFYPIDYEYKSITHSHLEGESLVMIFPADPKIYVIINGEIKLKVLPDYPFSTTIGSFKKRVLDPKKGTQFLWENLYFASIKFDSRNQLYYQMVMRPTTIRKEDVGKFPWSRLREFDVLVYNTNFDLVAHKKFNRSDSLLADMSYLKGGRLFIYKLQNNEDLVQFDSYEIM